MQIRARLSNPSTTVDVTRDSRCDTNRGARTVAALQYPCNTHHARHHLASHTIRREPCGLAYYACSRLSLRSRPSIRFRAATSPRSSASARVCSTASTCTRVPSDHCIATVHDRSHSSRCFRAELPRLAVPCHAVPCLAGSSHAILHCRRSVVLVVLCGSYDISKFPSLCANSPHNLVAVRFHRPLPLRTAHYLPRSPLFGRGRARAERAVSSPGIGRKCESA